MFVAAEVPKEQKQVVIDALKELEALKYPTGICYTVLTAIKSFEGLRVDPVLWGQFRNETPDLVVEHEYVDPDVSPYWIIGGDLYHLISACEQQHDNEGVYDAYLELVTSDGSAIESYEELSEEVLDDIETFAERRRSIVKLLIQKLEEA
ncbi:hypothetical protein AD45P4_00310 [Alteromonas phage vB_AmaP_AD45-P4]|nr:hypothetical protein AD45P3_00315 [Alteromonas phage vB_AmaP_AD45-P3]AGM47117.1 hypothetical protein AD45P4_00310 [Alteromonas phage vB_AmaP_AD45-P4]